MDERLRQELANWLEFYRELGIEEFYRRAPGAGGLSPATGERRIADSAPSGGTPPVAAVKPALTETKPVVTSTAPLPLPRAGASQTAVVAAPIRPPAPSLSLFETPPPKPSGPETLEQIRADLGDCHRCKLAGGRHTIVLGEGILTRNWCLLEKVREPTKTSRGGRS